MENEPLRHLPEDTDEIWQKNLEARKRLAERRMAEHDAQVMNDPTRSKN